MRAFDGFVDFVRKSEIIDGDDQAFDHWRAMEYPGEPAVASCEFKEYKSVIPLSLHERESRIMEYFQRAHPQAKRILQKRHVPHIRQRQSTLFDAGAVGLATRAAATPRT